MSPLVTSVRVRPLGYRSAHVTVFVRGKHSGQLVVDLEDADAVASRLFAKGEKVTIRPASGDCLYDLWRIDG